MYINNFREQILIEPIRNGADRLCIVSGYATPSMATWHIQALNEQNITPININLIVGMCVTEGLSWISHKGFLDVIETYNSIPNYSLFNCQYIYKGAPVHAKLYLWLKNNTPFKAFTGSPNYTQTAFSPRQRELLTDCDPDIAYTFFNDVEKNTIYCTNNDVEECIRLTNSRSILEDDGEVFAPNLENSVKLLLLSRDGEVGRRSGLNWGQRDGREPNQAYIPLPAEVARSGFFPTNRQHFFVITDDGKSLVLRVEQQNNKAITTPENNSRIGEYFRRRLGIANGMPVWKADLQRYGRTDVTFCKIDEEHYYMDFSVQSK